MNLSTVAKHKVAPRHHGKHPPAFLQRGPLTVRSGYVHHEGLRTGRPRYGLPVRAKQRPGQEDIPQASRKLSQQTATELWITGLIHFFLLV